MLNEKEKTIEELRLKKENEAAVRLQRFWKDGKIRLKWKKTVIGLKDNKKKMFANGVLVVMFLLQIV